ncbi:MAG: DUF1869 domain-containing protein, partial [Bradyrhizobium sp.]|nr:DUF1869 domain-containing protein [Bradyrhizobium sp.]
TLALENGRLHQKQEKIFLKPMVLYIPQQAVEAVNDLLSKLPDDREEGEFLLTVTNNNNGVSVDKTFSSLAALRAEIVKVAPHLGRIDQIEAGKIADIKTLAGKGGSLEKAPFKPLIEDFYLTNPIARASAVMAECSRLASGQMLTAAE